MESIKAFLKNKKIKIYLYLCTYLYGSLKYPWQEKTWHKQSCSRTLLQWTVCCLFWHLCVCVLVSLSRLLLQAHLFIWKWETKPNSICCCFPYAKWWVKKLSAYLLKAPTTSLHFCCTKIVNELNSMKQHSWKWLHYYFLYKKVQNICQPWIWTTERKTNL
jgi:hypothetical protein